MKTSIIYLLFICTCVGILSSCEDDDKYVPVPPKVTIASLNGAFTVMQEDTLILKASIESPLPATLSWSMNGEEVSTDTSYVFSMAEPGDYKVELKAQNADGEVTASATIDVYGKYKYGTFILNEGASLQGDKGGFLTFISPKGTVTNYAYQQENGSWLGSVPQDLLIANNKMYIVSQNGGNDGFLVIANAETLKKEISFQDELNGKVSWPTHVAVLGDDNVYLRDNAGVYLFHPSNKDVTFIKGTEGARKNTMAVVEGKVFVSKSNSVVVIEENKDTISQTINFGGNVSGVIKSADNNIWVSDASGKISKMDAKNYSIIQYNELPAEAARLIIPSYAAAPSITAKGDTLYMSALQTNIYRHIFSQNKTDLMVNAKDMVENSNIIYTTVAVHPVTGEVYLNSIKGYSTNVAFNHISVFDFSESTPKLNANYENYTRFPAGTFFTYNFK